MDCRGLRAHAHRSQEPGRTSPNNAASLDPVWAQVFWPLLVSETKDTGYCREASVDFRAKPSNDYHHLNWFQGGWLSFCTVATCPLQQGWLTATVREEQNPPGWIRRVTPGKRIPQKAHRESEQSKIFLNVWRSFDNVCWCSHRRWCIPPVSDAQKPCALFLSPVGSEELRGGLRGRWEQLLAARNLACVTTRCHGCPTEASLSQGTGSSEAVPFACRLPGNHRILIKPCGGGRAYAWLYPAAVGGGAAVGDFPGCHQSHGLPPAQRALGRELEVQDWFFRLACKSVFIRQKVS